MVAGYNAQGQYVDKQGNPSPNPADAAPGISQGISNLLGMPFTPGRDSGLPHETPIDPVHAQQALEGGMSGWETYMPIQKGVTGGLTPALGIQAGTLQEDIDQEAGGVGDVWDNVNLGAGDSPGAANAGDIEANKMLQRDLNSMGAQLAVDGIIGPKTKAAMEQAHLGAQGTSNTPSAVGTWPGPTAGGTNISTSPVKEVASGTTDTATAKEPPAETTEPVTQSADTSGQAGFERLLNAIGGGFDTARDVIMGLGNQANIGLDRYFHRPSAERDERLARKQAGQVRARDESIGDIGTQLYDIDQTVDAGGQLGNYPTDASAELGPGNQLLDRLLGTGHDTSLSTKDSIGAQIANRRNNPQSVEEALDVPLPAAANAPVKSSGTDRFGGVSKPPPYKAGVDIEKGTAALPQESDNSPLVDLVNQLATVSDAQRTGVISRLDPRDQKIVIDMLSDRDNIATGIVD